MLKMCKTIALCFNPFKPCIPYNSHSLFFFHFVQYYFTTPSIITPVFIVTWSFRIHSNMLICWFRDIYYYYQCWKQLYCLIFSWIHFFLILVRIERSEERHLFKIEIFCYIINIFIVSFGQFNASLFLFEKKKKYIYIYIYIYSPNLWMVV